MVADLGTAMTATSGITVGAILAYAPWLIVGLTLAAILLTRGGRQGMCKFYYLTRSLVCLELGAGGFIRIALVVAVPACAVAYTKGALAGGASGFDWHVFLTVLIAITIAGILANLLNLSLTFKKLLTPGAGLIFRDERKVGTAGILKKFSRCLLWGNAKPTDVRDIITDILDIVVLHVRDHRGSLRKDRPEVFANLLLADTAEMVVVARDATLHASAYQRPIPARYPKATVLCGRAVEAKKVLTIGDLTAEYQEAPQNKPYRSIMAVPLFRSGHDYAYGALSVDSSRPYFFESFRQGHVANSLENSLMPYCQLITMVLEALIDPSPEKMISALASSPVMSQNALAEEEGASDG